MQKNQLRVFTSEYHKYLFGRAILDFMKSKKVTSIIYLAKQGILQQKYLFKPL